MSYIKDLDEYTEKELLDELQHRKILQDQNLCDYCGRKSTEPVCRFPSRHNYSVTKNSLCKNK